MVLESLVPVQTAEKKPFEMLPLAFLYTTIAIFIGIWIFPNYASLIAVFFCVMACLPLMLHIIGFEERKLFVRGLEHEHHKKSIPFFVYLFVGMVLAFTFWFIAFPQNMVANLYNVQIATIEQINASLIGGWNAGFFTAILLNNIKVLAFCVLFSFIYGAGAIFILTWNASVIAVAIGNTIRNILAGFAGTVGALGAAHYFQAFSLGLLRYMIHGIPEIGSYFVAGLAGGMISVAVIKHNFMDAKFKKVMVDSAELILVAVSILVVAAVLEVFVSPLIPT